MTQLFYLYLAAGVLCLLCLNPQGFGQMIGSAFCVFFWPFLVISRWALKGRAELALKRQDQSLNQMLREWSAEHKDDTGQL